MNVSTDQAAPDAEGPVVTELFEFDVTPTRLGEMYVNTIVNTADLLLAHEYAMAAQARTAPPALLAPVHQMTRKHLLAFIDGATRQCDQFLNTLAPDAPDTTQNLRCAPLHDAAREGGTYAERVDRAMGSIGDPSTRENGFAELGSCAYGIQHLLNSPDLARHTRSALTDQQEVINSAIADATADDLRSFISGTRREQASRDELNICTSHL